MRKKKSASIKFPESYDHKEAELLLRPEVGAQAQFKKKKDPVTYRYDSSLDPQLSWDINGDRDIAEGLIDEMQQLSKKIAATKDEDERKSLSAQLQQCASHLKAISKPFLNWTGKAEHHDLKVPTLPLFIHERLSTQAILETVKNKKRDQQGSLFGDEQLDVSDRILKAYEHSTNWVNRLILGDSLVVMNSLLQYEKMRGQVQMIYFDPPYAVKYNSNFQPFVRRNKVTHGDDDDLTREPEMVQAYRDTWELGLHSYLTYMRDRLKLAYDLLKSDGSIFVQINDKNIHHVKELLDEVFGAKNFVSMITVRKSLPLGSTGLPGICDYILWYSRQEESYKFHQLFTNKPLGEDTQYTMLMFPDGTYRRMTDEEKEDVGSIPRDSKIFRWDKLTSTGYTESCFFDFELDGELIKRQNKSWRTNKDGMQRLIEKNRVHKVGDNPNYVLFFDDFPVKPLHNLWNEFQGAKDPIYVVQTNEEVIQRCMLMTTDPGDLILDITCGSGTSAYVAESWGRRWITCDISRVPIALARQRLLTATFPYYQLKDNDRGIISGFEFKRKQNKKGKEIGGIVPHVTLENIANDLPFKEEVLVDKPEKVSGIVRISGPFVVEASIPPPLNLDDVVEISDGLLDAEEESFGNYLTRMTETLRKAPVFYLPGNKQVTFKNIRQPARSYDIHAEAMQTNGAEKLVGFVFGPPNGAITEGALLNALKEANIKSYKHVYAIGYACQDAARKLINNADDIYGIGATYVDARMDIHMQDLLKTTRANQMFSVAAAPDVELIQLKKKSPDGEALYQIELKGLDIFDPVEMTVTHIDESNENELDRNVPAWFLDTDYNEMAFYVCQAFFPKTQAWNNLKRDLKGVYYDELWEHLAGTTSEPFVAGDQNKIAVKVIDPRGNEVMVVKRLSEARKEK